MTRKALKLSPLYASFTVYCDNETARDNLLTLLRELRYVATTKEIDGEFHISFVKTHEEINPIPTENYCTPNNYAVCIKNEYMGGGDPALGAILMRAFINSLPEAEKLPTNIVIYNSGIRVALKNCDTATTLKRLIYSGVGVVICGTCVDFYDARKEIVEEATIGNMYDITRILSSASNIVYP